jgi:regulator of sirC expression with transglutaminase-like and TPR domain
VVPDPAERFASLVSGEAEPALDEAALLIAAHAHPDLDVGAQLARLDELAASCPTPDLAGLITHLFGEAGFRGNSSHYDDPENSYLDRVLDRRLGIPITLSVLAIEVGRRIGVPLVGIGLPGHFLVRHAAGGEELLDPFNGGRSVPPEECEHLVRRIYGPALEFSASMLAPVATRAILARMLANLSHIFQRSQNQAGTAWALRLRTSIPGIGIADLGDLANAQAAIGRYEDAAATLDRLSLQAEEGPAGDRLRRRALQLRARLN